MSEQRRNLPSLDLLRGFEAAARNLSFTKAAAELFVTQSAVSRQVKTIEEHLGVALFARRHRALLLTEAGHDLYRATAQALRQISDAAARIRERGAGRTLTVTATIGFASLWLIPRLTDFRSQRPDIDIRISANNAMLDLEREGIEVAIRYCMSKMAPEGAIKLFGEVVHAKFAELKLQSAERCPKALGAMVKAAEVQFHHEVTNQYLWNHF